ncbi:PilZ domain-containing protein [Thiomicrorhabdus lithotrophica]|uniref:PilZ domain-containing protein n=1 Tax=Thiomicrorhabdus lithotrophica TaxID=2949997 RepID=A0ABY8CBI0_9GAMM|nr:PilZ domain-containing protein [Thiomicrorhabdus lithotrophica]WEJ63340.1 PilZ domain-containing protein [Thiomicrorhabdus lithotrophica]
MRKDQRSYYRIDVIMPCSYRILTLQQAEETLLPSSPDSKYIEEYFMENLSQLDEQINEVISHINQKSSLLATALTAMNSKINFVLQTIDEKQLARAIPQRLVNLSGGGIAIDVVEKVQLTDKVDLLIKPLQNESPILVRCDIVKITPLTNGSGGSSIALSYQSLSEDDRRKLVYFIQAKEIEFAQKNRDQDLTQQS